MEEIKSIRLRVNSSYGTDGKITISRVNNRKRIVTADRGVGNNLPELEFGNRYRDDSDDSIIENYLSVMNKDGRLPDDYEILQNPWSDIVPKPRQYGFEPYYLNNGSSIYIDWLDGTSAVGGTKWSDDEGNELDDIPDSEESKFYYTKRVSISPNYESGDPPMMFTDFSEIVKKDFDLADQKYSGNVDDMSIVESVIFYWKSQTLNYDDLDLCDPNNEFCNIIEYKSPIGDPQPEETEPTPTEESVQTQGTPKIKLSVVLPEELELKVKEDLNELKVYIGDPPLKPGEFVFQDDFDNLGELDPEFMESEFAGFEEVTSPPFSESSGGGDGAHDDDGSGNTGGVNNTVSGGGVTTPGSSVSSSGERIDISRTYSGSRKKIIDAYGWPILVEKKGNKYYGIKKAENGGRNVYKIDRDYTSKWTSKFKYTSKGGKVIVNRTLHNDMHAPLKAALQKIENAGFIGGVSKVSASVYARDTTNAPGLLSGHSFGVAMDFNSDIYGYGNKHYDRYLKDVKNPSSKNYKYAKAIQIMAGLGRFYWGGKYSGNKDTHHFTFNPFVS